MSEKNDILINGLTEKELYFVSEFAHKTKDASLIDKVVSEFKKEKHDTDAIIRKYATLAGMKPKWVENIEELLMTLEIYRRQEEVIINRLAGTLAAIGICISEEDLKHVETSKVREAVGRNIEIIAANQGTGIR